MELTDDVIAILMPLEMRRLRKDMAGWTIETLARHSGISSTQLSQFERGKNGLRRDQVETCQRLLLAAAAERQQLISKLFAAETQCESTVESVAAAPASEFAADEMETYVDLAR